MSMKATKINNLTATILATLALILAGCDRINPFTDGPELLTGPADINVRINSAGVADGAAVAIPDTSIGTARTRTITIENRGAEDLLIGGATISDDAAGAFSLDTSGMELTVTSGEQTTFEASFSPLTVGTYTATLTITSNDTDEAAYEIYFTGAGVDTSGCDIEIYQAAAHIPDGAGSYDFGEQTVGSNTTAVFTVSNTGGADLSVSNVALSGTDAGQFYSPGMNTTIAGGADADFTVEFNPTAEGDYTATVTVTSDDADEGEYTFTVTGTGVSAGTGDIYLTRGGSEVMDLETVLFPDTPLLTPVEYSFTIENQGAADLYIYDIVIYDDMNAAYSNESMTGTIASSDTYTFLVIFNPSIPGSNPARLEITTDDPDEGTYTVYLDGTCMGPDIEILQNTTTIANNDDFNYGTINVTDTLSVDFTISNTGTETLNIFGITLNDAGYGTGHFTIDTAPLTVAAGGTETLTITFTPSAVGTFTEQVIIQSDDPDEGEVAFTVTGTAEELPEITVEVGGSGIASGGIHNIGPVEANSGTGTAIFRITNTGNDDLTINNLEYYEATGQSTMGGFTTPHTLSKTEYIEFSVSFVPFSLGDIAGTITIESDDSDEGTYTIAVTGVGVSANPEIDVVWHGTSIASGATFNYQDSYINGPAITETFTIRNLGQSNLTITSTFLSGSSQYSITDSPDSTVAAGGKTTFSVQFTPGSVATTEDAAVNILNSDSDESTYTFDLSSLINEYTCYVDAASGDDSYDGSELTPYKTIAWAISKAGENAAIKVQPGTYGSGGSGDSFPITLQTGQRLIGNPGGNGSGTIIACELSGSIDSDNTCFNMGADSSVQGFDFTNLTGGTTFTFAIFASGYDFDASYNTFENSMYGAVYSNGGSFVSRSNNINTIDYGYYIMSANSTFIYENSFADTMHIPINIEYADPFTIISGNKIQGEGQVGIQVMNGNPVILGNEFPRNIEYDYGAILCTGASPTIRGNSFSSLNGVLISGTGQPNLGTAGSPGNNYFNSCAYYVINATSSYPMTIYAIGNYWYEGYSIPMHGTDIILDNSTQKVIYGTGSSDYEIGL